MPIGSMFMARRLWKNYGFKNNKTGVMPFGNYENEMDSIDAVVCGERVRGGAAEVGD